MGGSDSTVTLAYVSTGIKNQCVVHHVKSKLTLSEEEPISLMLNFRLKADMVCCRSVALDVVRTMSST
jgi:hypothetical protein